MVSAIVPLIIVATATTSPSVPVSACFFSFFFFFFFWAYSRPYLHGPSANGAKTVAVLCEKDTDRDPWDSCPEVMSEPLEERHFSEWRGENTFWAMYDSIRKVGMESRVRFDSP